MPLTATDAAILDLESKLWLQRGPKETAIHELGMSSPAFYARLNAILSTEAALAHDPILVRRLLRRRDERMRTRSVRDWAV